MSYDIKERWEKFNSENIQNILILKETKEKGIKYTWDEQLNILENYITENSKLPSFKCIYKGINIGRWLYTQKQNYENNKMREDIKERWENFTSK